MGRHRCQYYAALLSLTVAACTASVPQHRFPLPVDKPPAPKAELAPLPVVSDSRYDALVSTYEVKLYAAVPDMKRSRMSLTQMQRQVEAWNTAADDDSAVLGELAFRYRGTIQRLLIPLQKGEDRYAALRAALPVLQQAHLEVDDFRLVTLRHVVKTQTIRAAASDLERQFEQQGAMNHVTQFFALARQIDAVYAQLAPQDYDGPAINRTRYTLDAAQLLSAYGHDKAALAALDDTDKGLDDLQAVYSHSAPARVMIDSIAASAGSLRRAIKAHNPSLFAVIGDDIRGWLAGQGRDE